MNSSGIKRGLAATAVAALAVTGLPFLASSSSAVSGDEMVFVAAGPTRDDASVAAVGGFVVLKVKGLTDADRVNVKAIGTDLVSSADNANQTIVVNNAAIPPIVPDAASNPFGGLDGYAEMYVPVKVDTATTGGTASYALFVDDATAGVQASEARAQVTQATAGAPASISVAPATQTAPQNVASGDYTGTVKDSAGRTTQILGGGAEDITINPDATTAINGGVDDANVVIGVADVAEQGNFTFTAQSGTASLHTIAIDGPGAVDTTAQLDVVAAAAGLTAAEVDIATGADTWDGFGGGVFATPTQVRPDQGTVTFNLKSPANAGKTVSLTVTSANVTFGGLTSKTYTVTLNASGVGAIAVTPDAASIQAGDSFATSGNFATTINYVAAAPSAVTTSTDAATYLSSFGGTVNPTVTVTDQYGNPVTGVYVTVDRIGPTNGADAESARQAVNAEGKATFSLADTKATAASHADDTITVRVYPGQLGAELFNIPNAATIAYSATGQGAEFTLTVDGFLPAGSAYDPNTVFANPLTDTTANNAGDSTDEWITLGITGGTTGAPVTVTVDGGALLLKQGVAAETRLSQGSASDTSTIGGAGFRIIGTKTGLVNVTVVSGGVTHTAVVSVHSLSEGAVPAVNSEDTARNIELTGPAKAEAGDVVTFTAKVTDAFGNPVFGVPAASLSTLVNGAGQVVGNSGTSTAAGVLTFSVQIAESADSPVSLQVTGAGFDFGAAANRLTAASTTDDGAGLTASVGVATATIADVVNIEKLQAAVDAAQAKVDTLTDNLAAAKGDLAVAKAERSVAQAEVKQAKKDLRQAKKHHHGVKAARKALRQARGDLRIASAKVAAEQGKVNTATERLAAAQAELEAAQQALEDAQA